MCAIAAIIRRQILTRGKVLGNANEEHGMQLKPVTTEERGTKYTTCVCWFHRCRRHSQRHAQYFSQRVSSALAVMRSCYYEAVRRSRRKTLYKCCSPFIIGKDRQSNSTTLCNTFMYFSKERDYVVLLRTYSCTTTDSISILKCKVLEHYSSVYAPRELTDWLIGCFFVYLCTA